MVLSLRLLGEFTLCDETGATLALPTRKTWALLGYLAVHADRPQSRDRLMALLWSDRDERQARKSLSHALLSIRKLDKSGDRPLIDTKGERVTLRSDAMDSDVVRFRALLAGQPADAATLYNGPLLHGLLIPDPVFEEWLEVTRSELHDLVCDALERSIEATAAEDDNNDAIDAARQLIRLDRVRESGHQQLMRLLYERGDRASALRQYQICVEVLEKELAVEPGPMTKALYEAIRRDDSVHATVEALAQTRVDPPIGATLVPPRKPKRPFRRVLAWAVAIALFIGVGAIALHNTPWTQPSSNIPAEETAKVLPENRSIAVLPFENRSGNPGQDYFSDGVTEDIIARLAKLPGMSVATRTASFTYKDRPVDLSQVGQALGVHYVLDGSIEKVEGRLRIAARLIEAGTGANLWTAQYDRMLRDLFGVQDEIVREVAVAFGVKPAVIEEFRSDIRATYNVEAYDHFLRGVNIVRNARTKDSYTQGRELFEKAIALDPLYAQAIAWFSYVRSVEENAQQEESHARALERSAEIAKQAQEIARMQASEITRHAEEIAKNMAAEISREIAAMSERKQAAELALKQAVEVAKRQAVESARKYAEEIVQKQAAEIARKQAAEFAKQAQKMVRNQAADIVRRAGEIARTKAEEIVRKEDLASVRKHAVEVARKQAAAVAREQAVEIARQAQAMARKTAAEIARQAEEIARRKAEEVVRDQTDKIVRQRAGEIALRALFTLKQVEKFLASTPVPPVVPKYFATPSERAAWYGEARRTVVRRYDQFLAPQHLKQVTFICREDAGRAPRQFCRDIAARLRLLQQSKAKKFTLLNQQYRLAVSSRKQLIAENEAAPAPKDAAPAQKREPSISREGIERYWRNRIEAVKRDGLYKDCDWAAESPGTDPGIVIGECEERGKQLRIYSVMLKFGQMPPDAEVATLLKPPTGPTVDYGNDRDAIEQAVSDFYFMFGYDGDAPSNIPVHKIYNFRIFSAQKIDDNQLVILAKYFLDGNGNGAAELNLKSRFLMKKKKNGSFTIIQRWTAKAQPDSALMIALEAVGTSPVLAENWAWGMGQSSGKIATKGAKK